MSRRHKNHHRRDKTKMQIEERQQTRELRDAYRGDYEEFLDDYDDDERGEDVELELVDIGELKKLREVKELKDIRIMPKDPQEEYELEPEEPQKWYVLDTNLIISCVDVLYDPRDKDWREPLNFKPDISHAHLIIPDMVREELNNLKNEHSFRGMMAKIALKRLANFFPNSGRKLSEIMNLEKPIATGWNDQVISVLPLHNGFSKNLPWKPAETDNDGWIAVTALAATLIREKKFPTNCEYISNYELMEQRSDSKDVFLLTNDYDLLTKADEYGVAVQCYSFERREPYTGFREVKVSPEVFEKYYHEEYLSREEFEECLPDELPLIANEYIAMEPEGDIYPKGYFSADIPFVNVARYHKRNDMLYPMRFMNHEGKTPPNAGIATYFDALNDDRVDVVIATGEAGTGKTYQAIAHAIRTVSEGKYSRAVLVTTISAKNPLGALKGGQKEKMEPMVAFCKDAISSYLSNTPEFKKKREQLRKFGDTISDEDAEEYYESKSSRKKSRKNKMYVNYDYDSDEYLDYEDFEETNSRRGRNKQKKDAKDTRKNQMSFHDLLKKEVDEIFDRYFECYPYEQVQGRSFEDAIIILDEFQRIHDVDDLHTIITRTSRNSKLIICGDVAQIHQSTSEKMLMNGVTYARARYFDWERCANVYLVEQMRNVVAEYETEHYRRAYRRIGLF